MIKIYPSTWYYNACVHGFLELLAFGIGKEAVEGLFQDDGTVEIPKDLMQAVFSTEEIEMPLEYTASKKVPDEAKDMKRITWWWFHKSYLDISNDIIFELDKKIENKLFEQYLKGKGIGKLFEILKGFYGEEEPPVNKEDLGKLFYSKPHVASLSKAEYVNLNVESICKKFFSKSGLHENLIQPNSTTWDERVTFLNNWFTIPDTFAGKYICSFCGGYFTPEDTQERTEIFFSRLISTGLGSSIAAFPNATWNNTPNLMMCNCCHSFFLCFHFVHRERHFINTDSLKVNWQIKHLIWLESQSNNRTYQKNMLSAISVNNNLRSSLSSWSRQNMEIVTFSGNEGIEHRPLSPVVAELFSVPRISSALNALSYWNCQVLWDVILQERFSHLLVIIYKCFRYFLTGNSFLKKDPDMIADAKNPLDTLNKLLFLTEGIYSYLGGEKTVVDMKQIRKDAETGPFNVEHNSSKGIIYKILEATRMNKKPEVYYMLLRQYIANETEFPLSLMELFEVKDDGIFKIGIYNYIAGLSGKEDVFEE